MWRVRSHYRNISFFKHFFSGRTWDKTRKLHCKKVKNMLNSTTSIMIPTWTKHFKLTDKRFGDVLEISCRSQAHNLLAVGLNLRNGNYRCSSALTLMIRHCQYPSFRFAATMPTFIMCALVRRRAACKTLHLAFPFQLLSGYWLHKILPHLILPLQVVAE